MTFDAVPLQITFDYLVGMQTLAGKIPLASRSVPHCLLLSKNQLEGNMSSNGIGTIPRGLCKGDTIGLASRSGRYNDVLLNMLARGRAHLEPL